MKTIAHTVRAVQRRLNSEEIVLPEFAMPEAEVDPDSAPAPLFTTDDDYTVGTMKLLSYKRFKNGDEWS